MQIYLDEKIIFIHFCIHINYMTYELANNVLLILGMHDNTSVPGF